jgi:beta-lactamase superfamily II metal-dependent hydrolase
MWYGKCWYLNKRRFNKFGTLLTGDQELKTKKDFNSFILHFQNKLKHIEVFQIPHHGSHANWNPMPNKLSSLDIGCYVINHGFGRKNHPHIKVLDNIKNNTCRVIVLNNELAYFNYLVKHY